MLFKNKFKRRIAMAATAMALAAGGVAITALPASATVVYQQVRNFYSPHNYGNLNTDIEWINTGAGAFAFVNGGTLSDIQNDGHGPYLHVFANALGFTYGRVLNCDIHNTNGYITSVSVTGCNFTGNGTGRIDSIDVWVCNGGTAAGDNTVEDGCYGRHDYNQAVHPGMASVSLGWQDKPTSHYEIIM